MTTQTSVNVLELFSQAAYEIDGKKLTGLTKDTVISTLGMDSVAMMELVSYCEEKLCVSIPDEELGKIRTVGDLARSIQKVVPQGTTVTA